ncbi:hypothetical protein BCR32DRAFT_235266 [Anaeromyces robustus]|uniref:alpha-galactosidase n=1 Tax=Anaeromyces robustus TaxID=1754192 RepID=A0A1Y1WX51_9FUNG|nr:hypothetical protein BCR32DRAFT_235266 [Anaeromyces robustus]|eukprot:ORX78110.1 hypothetical protein BCR32DRAFT_235266 [Anaeromyces robustus]
MNFKISVQSIILIFSLISLPIVNARWQPNPGLKWNWCLGENPNRLSIPKGEYDVIDIDLLDVTKETISHMHHLGLKVICYFSAGTYEPFRTESQGMLKIPGLVRNKMEEWDENWLDYRIEGIKPFMTERLDIAKAKDCDGVEFDNVDAYTNTFWDDPLTASDQIKYNRWLAQEAHDRGLSAGLKNCVGLLSDLVSNFDFAINEECSEYNECHQYSIFLNKNKAVFVALYGYISNSKFMSRVCSEVNNMNLSTIIKDPSEDLKYPYIRFSFSKYCHSVSSKTTKTLLIYTKTGIIPTSTNGRCGTIYGKCQTGRCCSKYGWCGKSINYCGIGCQKAFGICD